MDALVARLKFPKLVISNAGVVSGYPRPTPKALQMGTGGVRGGGQIKAGEVWFATGVIFFPIPVPKIADQGVGTHGVLRCPDLCEKSGVGHIV